MAKKTGKPKAAKGLAASGGRRFDADQVLKGIDKYLPVAKLIAEATPNLFDDAFVVLLEGVRERLPEVLDLLAGTPAKE